jgi:hypothetical protein
LDSGEPFGGYYFPWNIEETLNIVDITSLIETRFAGLFSQELLGSG